MEEKEILLVDNRRIKHQTIMDDKTREHTAYKLLEKVSKTHEALLEEWVGCFHDESRHGNTRGSGNYEVLTDLTNLAKSEIFETFRDETRQKDCKRNFLLRLISDDKNIAYHSAIRKPRPRVQLALAFVECLAEDDRFTGFLADTLSLQTSAAEAMKMAGKEPGLKEKMGGADQFSGNNKDKAQGSSIVIEMEQVLEQDENADETTKLNEKRSKRGNGEIEMAQVMAWGKRINGIIHEAAKSGRCAMLWRVLTAENVNYVNNVGETALHLAAEFEHLGDVHILLACGAEFKVDNRGCTPLHSAAMAVNPSAEVAKDLIANLADAADRSGPRRRRINSLDEDGNTALHVAAGNINVSEEFIDTFKSADPLLQNKNRDTPFHTAAKSTNPQTIIYMLNTFAPSKLGWDIDDADRNRVNDKISGVSYPKLLTICAESGNAEAVELLIQHGADLSTNVICRIVRKSVECPEKTEQLLAVYRTIVDNAVTWRCLEENIKLITKGSSLYNKYLQETMMWLITRPDTRLYSSEHMCATNAIMCAIEIGASEFLEEIVNTQGVFRFDSSDGRAKIYDVTNFVGKTKGHVNKADKGNQSGSASERDYSEQLGVSSIHYLKHLVRNDNMWYEKKIFDKEPIKGITKRYIRWSQKFFFILALLQLVYMIFYSYIYMPTTCSLVELFSLNATASNCSWISDNRSSTNALSLLSNPSPLWFVWPAILCVVIALIFFAQRVFTFVDLVKFIISEFKIWGIKFMYKLVLDIRFIFKRIKPMRILVSIGQQFTSTSFCVSVFYWYTQYGDKTDYHSYVSATSMILLFGWITDFFFFSEIMMNFCLFSQVLKEIVVKDIALNFLLVFVFTFLGFSFAMHALRISELPSDDVMYLGATVYDVFAAAVGYGGYFQTARDERLKAGINFGLFEVVVVGYVCVTAIVLLNVLIAMINHRYDKAMKRAECIWRFNMLSIAVAFDAFLSLFEKEPNSDDRSQQQFQKYNFDISTDIFIDRTVLVVKRSLPKRKV